MSLAAHVLLPLLFATPTWVPQGSKPKVSELTALRSAFRKHKKPEAVFARRDQALRAAASLDSGEAAQALLRAYANLESECIPLMQKRHKILLKDSGERLQRLRDKMQPLHDLQKRIRRQLSTMRSSDAKLELGKMLAQKRLPLQLKLTGARAAAELFDMERMRPKQSQKLEELLVILEAAKSLEVRGREFASFAFAALGRPEETAKRCALATLAAIQVPKSLPVLVDFLAQDHPHHLKVEAGRTLCVLTQQKLGASHVSWKAWLARDGQAYVDGEKRLGGGKPDTQASTGAGYYFGIPLDRSSILFVHDNSLSMRQPLGEKTRLQHSLDELYKALDALKPTQRFNIVLLANRIWSFETKQVAATKKNVQRAKDWMRYQPIELGTCIYNALDTAFMLAGRGVRDRFYDAEIDTMFLLSDGAPTPYLARGGRGARGGGGNQPPRSRESAGWILDAVERWNVFDRVQIHTILLGGRRGGQGRGGPRGGGRNSTNFMKRLAEQNNGRFEAVGGPTNNPGGDPGRGRRRTP